MTKPREWTITKNAVKETYHEELVYRPQADGPCPEEWSDRILAREITPDTIIIPIKELRAIIEESYEFRFKRKLPIDYMAFVIDRLLAQDDMPKRGVE